MVRLGKACGWWEIAGSELWAIVITELWPIAGVERQIAGTELWGITGSEGYFGSLEARGGF